MTIFNSKLLVYQRVTDMSLKIPSLNAKIPRGIAGLEQSGGVCKVAFSFLAKESVEATESGLGWGFFIGKIGRNLIENMENCG